MKVNASVSGGTDNLIEQARRWNGTGSALDTAELLIDLADALEAAEAEVARLRTDLGEEKP